MNSIRISLASAFCIVAFGSLSREARADGCDFENACSIGGSGTEFSATITSGTAISGEAISNGTGVTGFSATGVGVQGSSSTSNGVQGASSSGAGVYATSSSGAGVYGSGFYGGQFASTQNDGVHATIAVSGHGAVSGTCDSGYSCDGIYGNSWATGTTYAGVVGNNSSTGYGGIFTSGGTYSAYFAEDINIQGTAFGPSDARLKKNIKPIANAMEQLLRLKGVTYEWKEPEKHSHATGTQIGFIAQDVEQVFPGWVHTDTDGFKTLSVGQVEGLEVESIRQLKAENDALKERMKAVEAGGPRGMVSGFGERGMVGLGMFAIAGAIVFAASRRKRSEAQF